MQEKRCVNLGIHPNVWLASLKVRHKDTKKPPKRYVVAEKVNPIAAGF